MKSPSKFTRQDIIALYLASYRGEWVQSHYLIKQNTAYGFIGTRGIMRAKEISYLGYHIVGNKKYYIERDNKHGKYAQFRCTKIEDLEIKGEVKEISGIPTFAEIENEPVLFV